MCNSIKAREATLLQRIREGKMKTVDPKKDPSVSTAIPAPPAHFRRTTVPTVHRKYGYMDREMGQKGTRDRCMNHNGLVHRYHPPSPVGTPAWYFQRQINETTYRREADSNNKKKNPDQSDFPRALSSDGRPSPHGRNQTIPTLKRFGLKCL